MLNKVKFSVKKYMRSRKQKGVSVLVAAFCLPIFMAGGVAAVDLGAYWSHASKLQNAADAAALAGAAIYAKYEENRNSDLSNHPKSDAVAHQYVGINLHNDENDDHTVYKKNTPLIHTKFGQEDVSASADPNYEKQYKGKIYYRVTLEDSSPSYFAKFFSIADPEVTVEAIARIETDRRVNPPKGEDPNPVTDLFIFKNRINVVNSIDNPDQWDSPTRKGNGTEGSGPIRTTFDGSIKFTNHNAGRSGDPKIIASDQQSQMTHFFTKKAQEEIDAGHVSMHDLNTGATSDTEATYDKDTGKATNLESGLWTEPEVKDYNMEDEFGNLMAKKAEKVSVEANQTITSQYIASEMSSTWSDDRDSYGIIPGVINVSRETITSGNVNIDIDTPLPGYNDEKLKDDPVYIYMNEEDGKAMTGVININISADTGRPLIIVMPKATQVHFNILDGANFRGIIYAPECGNNGEWDEGVLVNGSGSFNGTIMAGAINLRGSINYTYENFSTAGGNEGDDQEGTVISYDSTIGLVSKEDPEEDGVGDWIAAASN